MNPLLKDLIKNMKSVDNEEIFFYDISNEKKDFKLRYLSLNETNNFLNKKKEFQGEFLTLKDLLLMLDDIFESQSNSFKKCEQRIKSAFNKVIDFVVDKIKIEENKALEFLYEMKSNKICNHMSNYEKELLNLGDDKINFQHKFSEMLENVDKMKIEIQEFFISVENIERENEQFIKNFTFFNKNLLNSLILKNPLNDKSVEVKNNGLIASNISTGHSCIISNISFNKKVKLNFKVNKMERNHWMYFGILQKIDNLNQNSYSCKTSYGWAKNSIQLYIDGQCNYCPSNYDGDINEGDRLILSIIPEEGKLHLKNLRSNKEYSLDIPKGLDYYFHFNLHGKNDEIEIISVN